MQLHTVSQQQQHKENKMGRFISGSSATDVGFARAEVFTSAGASSWTVPAGVSKAKVFVIGAGSNYRATEMCFVSTACCSGVATPNVDYCLNFIGHLPGAGGGYAEKTIDGVAPGASMTINVGSVGGLTASSASIGSTTVTANNATETTISWNCTSNSTPRDNTLDNKVVLGFDLPVCGYINCINGHFNAGGTAAGGDINRTGGSGEFAPYFREDASFDGTVSVVSPGGSGGSSIQGYTCTSERRTGYDYSFGGTRYNCVCTKAYMLPGVKLNGDTCGCCFNASSGTIYQCSCLITYHNVFGGQCYYNMNWANCICNRMCSGAYLCSAAGGGGGGAAVTGTAIAKSDGTSTDFPGNFPNADDKWATNACPVTVGADSGNSGADGQHGTAEGPILSPVAGTGGGDAGGGDTGLSNTVVCYVGFGQDHFTFYFGSGISNWPCARMENLYGSGGAAGYWLMGYSKDTQAVKKSTSQLPLSTLKARDGTNVNDLNFGSGATMNEAAGPGGGGNRTYPTGGVGAVVVVY
jgi:hypothetical protein